jgi:molecular chaperone GrpE
MNEAAPKPDENTPETENTETAPAPLAALQAELAETRDKMLRALADADNTRKRAERTQIDTTKFAVAGFARDLLDVADNLRRAIDSDPAEQRAGNELVNTLLQGVEATERVMLSTLEKNGVRKIAPTSGTFDPNHHEVMFEAEIAGKRAGEIIQLIEPGYMIHERLLRPARVGVAKGDPAMPSAHQLDESV